MFKKKSPYITPLVLHIVGNDNIGGVNNVVYEILKGGVKQHWPINFEVLVLELSQEKKLKEKFNKINVPVYYLGGRLNMNYYKNFFLIRNFLKKKNPQIIHSHMLAPNFYTALASLGMKIIHFTHTHGYHYVNPDWDIKKTPVPLQHRLAQCFTYSRSHENIFVSKKVAMDIFKTAFYFRKNYLIIHNGVDIDYYKPIKNKVKTDKVIKIITVSRFSPEKNLKFLINQIFNLTKVYNYIYIYICGYGNDKEILFKYIHDLSISDRIKLIDLSNNRYNLKSILQSADIYVNVSLTEGLPLSILEAMACGLPVVASSVGGVSEIIENNVNGLLFDLDVKDNFKFCLEKLLFDSDFRNTISKNARKTIIEKFSNEVFLYNIKKLYDKYLLR